MYFKVAPRQTISAAVLPKVRTPLVLHSSYSQTLKFTGTHDHDFKFSKLLCWRHGVDRDKGKGMVLGYYGIFFADGMLY